MGGEIGRGLSAEDKVRVTIAVAMYSTVQSCPVLSCIASNKYVLSSVHHPANGSMDEGSSALATGMLWGRRRGRGREREGDRGRESNGEGDEGRRTFFHVDDLGAWAFFHSWISMRRGRADSVHGWVVGSWMGAGVLVSNQSVTLESRVLRAG